MKFATATYILISAVIVLGILIYSVNITLPCSPESSMLFRIVPSLLPCPTGTSTSDLSATAAKQAVFSIDSPATSSVGSQISITIVMDPKGVAVNALDAKIAYSPNALQFIAKDEDASPFSIRLFEQSDSTSTEIIQVQPNPGISHAATIARLTFRAITPGTTTIYFESSSQILANDGLGTNILASQNSATINIVPAAPAVPTAPAAPAVLPR
ncbi:MAG TPA: cohesin domain-containing protein [Candidatus Paceibacterota bacterium]|nr:cohesin domain-containing protein [Candidatus Paceibacterota bacterium]